MKIEAEFYPLYLSEAEKEKTHAWGIANVMVNGIGIHNIRAINKKSDNGEWQHFFAYPRLKVGDRYQDVIQLNKQQKAEIETAIQQTIKQNILKAAPEIEVEKINIIDNKPNPKSKLLAIGDVKANGIGVKSIRLYENEEGGRYAQLPQYQDAKGEWKNLVQFDNAMFAIRELSRCMDAAYEAKRAELGKVPGQDQKSKCR